MIEKELPAPNAPGEADALAHSFRGARILITGGLGFIGSALAHRLAEFDSVVTLVDNELAHSGANYFNIASIRERVRLVAGDIRDPDVLPPLVSGQDYLFNLAGQAVFVPGLGALLGVGIQGPVGADHLDLVAGREHVVLNSDAELAHGIAVGRDGDKARKGNLPCNRCDSLSCSMPIGSSPTTATT